MRRPPDVHDARAGLWAWRALRSVRAQLRAGAMRDVHVPAPPPRAPARGPCGARRARARGALVPGARAGAAALAAGAGRSRATWSSARTDRRPATFAAHAWLEGEPLPDRAPVRRDDAPDAVTLAPIELATGIVFGVTPRPLPPRPRRRRRRSRPRSARRSQRGRCSSPSLAGATRPRCWPLRPPSRGGRGCPLPCRSRCARPTSRSRTSPNGRSASSRHSGSTTGCGSRSPTSSTASARYALRALRRHGLLWPFNAHFHVPHARAGRGRDAADGRRRRRAVGRRRAPSDVRRRRHALRLAPFARAARRARAPRADRPSRGCAKARRRQAARLAAGESAAVPWTAAGGWRSRAACATQRRHRRTGRAGRRRGRGDRPSAARSRAVGGARGRRAARGFAGRDDALAGVAGHLLPPELVARRTKASFDARVLRRARARVRAGLGRQRGPGRARRRRPPCARTGWAAAPDPHACTLLQAALAGVSRRSRPAAGRRSRAVSPSRAGGSAAGAAGR